MIKNTYDLFIASRLISSQNNEKEIDPEINISSHYTELKVSLNKISIMP